MSNNNDDNNSNLQLFDWLLTNPILDMTTTALPVNNVPGNEAIGNVNSLQALFDSPLPEAMSFSPLEAIPTQQQQLDGLSLSNSTQSLFNTASSSTTMPVMNHTPGTQSTSSPSPDGRGSSNSGGSMSDDHLHQDDERSRQQEDQSDRPSESELKKMTSKERRQLRNKISARKFRSRKKEYVTTLENDLQRQKHENERLNLEVSFIRENADKLQKERDDLKLQLALCREKNRELMRRLDKGGSSSSSSSPTPPENNNDNNPSSSSSSSNGSKSPNAPDLDISLLSADKIHSLEKSLPTEIAVASSTITDNSNTAPPSPPSSPKHHTHFTSKSYQQDITVHNKNNNSSDNLSSLPNNPSLAAALIWTLLGYGMTLLASQDYVYRDRSLPPSSSTDNTNRSRTHSKPSVMNLGSTTIAQRPIRKILKERQCTILEQQPSSQPIHSHQSIYQHPHQTYSQSSSVVK
ncbi:hypothetical protein LRAMOSA10897 [Lichtheimia ramosa]|uniref:BZIP domain-containing protein n=1 Tax=Lichtheimia ramosa TaxID=688394 RepID=A0A077WSA3_9FUNG|nr:hypothetical protein LRAMOSA10897 [Lichtheimia ramosa]